MFKKSKVNHVLLAAYSLVGAVVLSAAISHYEGLIELKLGLSGAQLTIDGRSDTRIGK